MSSSLPLVSICIPVYNGARFLEATLEAALAQDYENLEIVVTVDESTDGSWEILENARARNPAKRFSVYKNPQRLGMGGNWSRAVEMATGEYVKVMGQDDLLAPNCIRRQSAFLAAHPDCRLVAAACHIVRPSGKVLLTRKRFGEGTILPTEELIAQCLGVAGNRIGEPVTVLARRECYASEKFDASYSYFTDVEMWFRAGMGGKIGFLGEPLCGFRIHRSACSWGQQSCAYKEFLRLESAYARFTKTHGIARCRRWLMGNLAVVARTAIYRVFG
jgi:glycosyltransferase involved in cell wall biosynthesis